MEPRSCCHGKAWHVEKFESNDRSFKEADIIKPDTHSESASRVKESNSIEANQAWRK
jgi:hypothetical protein